MSITESPKTLPPLIREVCTNLPETEPFSPRQRQIYHEMVKDVPQHEFSVFAEHAINQIGLEEFGLEKLDVRHLCVAQYYRSMIGAMDQHFDTHRNDFKASLSSGKDLFAALMTIQIPACEKWGRLDLNVGELFTLYETIIRSDSLYPKPAQAKLAQTYATLITTASNALVSEGTNPLQLTTQEAWQVKTNTNIPHLHMIFDLIFSSFLDHPRYIFAQHRLESAKMAYQIRNDFQGITKDWQNVNANLFIATAIDLGEAQQLCANLPLLETSNGVFNPTKTTEEVIPLTYWFYQAVQNELLTQAGLNQDLREVISLV